MAASVNIHDAKTHFSKLVTKVENGEEILISRAGKPVARLVPLDAKPKKRKLGILDGFYETVLDDIDTPFEKEIHEMFYGNSDKFKDL